MSRRAMVLGKSPSAHSPQSVIVAIIVVWWGYASVATVWAFLLVGLDFAGDALLVIRNASTSGLASITVLTIVNFVFLGLATWTLRAHMRAEVSNVNSPKNYQLVANLCRGFAGLATLGTAFLPLLITAESVAYNAVGGQLDSQVGVASPAVYLAIPVGVVGLLVSWLVSVWMRRAHPSP